MEEQAQSLVTGHVKRYTEDSNTAAEVFRREKRVNDTTENFDDSDEEPIQFQAKEGPVQPADIQLRIDRPEEEKTVEDDDAERGTFSNKLDFLFSCISVSVGLGNVWRFPYLCYKNGGGTFLLIYFIAMFACGIPIFFQEVAAGQYLGTGGLTMVGQLVPMLQGVGYATMTIVFWLDIYYCIIISWTLYYLIMTFIHIPELPWRDCGNEWNSENCYSESENVTREGVSSAALSVRSNLSKSPVEEYWDYKVLGITDGISDLGGIQWGLLGTLFLGWVIVYLIIWKGLHSSGKIVWFTALFPYFVMITLLFRAITLEGAGQGLLLYITPDWSKLYTSECWIDSATQIFFAYSIGTGALPALGSYNKFYHNCVKDTVITCMVNTATCLLAGTVTFSILGHMAHNQGVDVASVVNSGPGLVFITYPEVVLKLPGGSVWAVVFFFMLVTIGIDSEFCIVESLVTGIVDMWPEQLRPKRRQFTTALCLLLFALGVPMVTQGGAYIFQLMDFYGASGIPILWCCFFQTIAIGWIFGTKKFANCVEQMTGFKPNLYWTLTWGVIAPLVMAVIFLFYCFRWEPVKYGTVEYPPWAHTIGFFMSLSSMVWIPGYAIYWMCTTRGSIKDRLIKGITPDIKSNRCKLASKSSDAHMMNESSARLIKNQSSFLTPAPSFVGQQQQQ